jgi:hypothetical protein
VVGASTGRPTAIPLTTFTVQIAFEVLNATSIPLNVTISSVWSAIKVTLNMSSDEVRFYGIQNSPLVRFLMSSENKDFLIFNFIAPTGFPQEYNKSTPYENFLVDKLSQAISSGHINEIFHNFLVNSGHNMGKTLPSIVSITVVRAMLSPPSQSPTRNLNSNSVAVSNDSKSDDKTVLISALTVGLLLLFCIGTCGAYYWRTKLFKPSQLDPAISLPSDVEEPMIGMDRYYPFGYSDIQSMNPAMHLKRKTKEVTEVQNMDMDSDG